MYIWVEMFVILSLTRHYPKSIKVPYWSGNLGPFKFTLQRYIVSDVDVIIQRPWIINKEKQQYLSWNVCYSH
jgi:hypothetical protein